MPGSQCDCCKTWRKTNSDLRSCSNRKIMFILRNSKNCDLRSGSKLCSKCRSYAYHVIQARQIPISSSVRTTRNLASTSTADDATDEQPNIHLSIPRCHNSNKCCIICKRKICLVTIPKAARTQAFIETGIYITSAKRCCKTHITGSVFSDLALLALRPASENTLMYEKDVVNLLRDIRKAAKKKGLDFDTPGRISDSDYYTLMGISMSNFNCIFELVKSKIRSSKQRSSRTCLAVLLVKLRTGLSNGVLSTLFNIRKRLISSSVQCVRQAMIENFVPLYLGTEHVTRTQVIEKYTRPLAKTLFIPDDNNDTVILVADGTYIYIQKSSNYSFQRRSFSLHKGRPLVKPMMLVTTSGYILDVFGPYFADSKNNDANILKHILKKDAHNIREWLKPDDVIIVDRGFRDCLELLEEMGLVHEMPRFLNKQQQFSTEDANKTRLVTKVRWVVEAVNGQMKNWRALDKVVPNTQIPYIGDYVRIICAILNAFHPTRIKNTEDDEIIAQRMLDLVGTPNQLQKMIEEKGWTRKKAIWSKLTDTDLLDFPRLTWDELRHLTLGVYQLKQSQSYTQEHLNEEGLYSLYVHREDDSVIRVQLRSRHTSSKNYNIWIKIERSNIAHIQWYCQCKVGARVVGCCAHVASVLWFLAYWRYNSTEIKRPSLEYPHTLLDAAPGGWSSSDSDQESEENNS